MTQDNLIEVRDLSVEFVAGETPQRVVQGISFDIRRGETLALVGESGSGKSVTAHSILRLLPYPLARHPTGTITYGGHDLLSADEKKLRHIRGNRIAMIFQEPMTSLNPLHNIEKQINEVLGIHKGLTGKAATQRTLELLELVGIPEPHKRLKALPHELSGGQRQRVMIAMALSCEPEILIADEPTTALDVTIQAQILELMKSLQDQLGMAIIMITHDLGVVAQLCDQIIVMYAGSICERGTAEDIFYNPHHSYTKGLLKSIPTVDMEGKKLEPITGTPIDLLNMPKGCPFAPRCDDAMHICINEKCDYIDINEHHSAACWMNVKELLEEQKGGASNE